MIHEGHDGLFVCFAAILHGYHWNKSKGIWWTDEEHTQEDCSISTVVQMSVFPWSLCGFFFLNCFYVAAGTPLSLIYHHKCRFQISGTFHLLL